MKRPDITPGPWETADALVTNAEGDFVCDCLPDIGGDPKHPRVVADAKAIAALPALLDALEEVYDRGHNIADALREAGFHPDNTNRILDLVRESLLKVGYSYDNANA